MVFGQKDYSNFLIGYNYQIPGLGLDSTPRWDVDDTILLNHGYGKGRLTFTKKGKLLMQQNGSGCENVSLFVAIQLISSRYKRYKESIFGNYSYDQKEQLLTLRYRKNEYRFKIIRLCFGRCEFEGFELRLIE
ncbi:MAG: hypothetical protein COA58_05430 [Bacteroidetes bacterium]|nr:MAG: hypothetical protein COA58_05430 [Bacteroidota bacterium]